MKIHLLKPHQQYSILAGSIQNPGEEATGAVCLKIKSNLIDNIALASTDKNGHNETYLDFSNYFLCPGLIDCHVHLALDGIDFSASTKRWDNHYELISHLHKSMDRTIKSGIVIVRDGGDREAVVLNFKNNLATATLPSHDACPAVPTILSPGQAIHAKGRYGSFLGTPVQNKQQIAETVKHLWQKGADFIKVLVTGIVSFQEYGSIGAAQFHQEDLSYLVQQAHGFGLKVMAHANGDDSVQTAIKAGVNSIEHGYFISQSTIQMLADTQIPWIPTIIPVAIQCDTNKKAAWSETEQQIIEKTYKKHLESIAFAHQQGVILGVGTDAGAAGVLHGDGFHQELRLLHQAGLSAKDVFQLATKNGAKILGQDKFYGSLIKGKKPAILVLRTNPCNNINALRELEAIILPEQ